MIESILEYLSNHPPGAWAGPLLGVIAFVETLFPPVPGDILFIVISGWAVSGGFSLAMTALCGVTGCIMASCVLFYVGHKPGKQFVEGWLKRKVDPERIDKAKSLIADRGPVILALSRFIPGIRSLLVLMAGSSGMRFALAAVPISFSAVAWYLLLAAAGSILGSNIQAAEGFLRQFEIWIWIILGIVTLIILIAGIRRRKMKT